MNKGVADYFAAIPENRKARISELHELIINLYPDAVVDLKYKMPTYRVGEGRVALANQKNYISLYTCGYYPIEAFRKNNPGTKTGKGCINFRDKDSLPVPDIKALIRHAIDHPKGNASWRRLAIYFTRKASAIFALNGARCNNESASSFQQRFQD